MRIKRFLLAALIGVASAAFGQAYPIKPVKIIVPYPPGGVTDLFARVLAQQMQDSLGQPFLVENKPGASQMVGAMLWPRRRPTATRSTSAASPASR